MPTLQLTFVLALLMPYGSRRQEGPAVAVGHLCLIQTGHGFT